MSQELFNGRILDEIMARAQTLRTRAMTELAGLRSRVPAMQERARFMQTRFTQERSAKAQSPEGTQTQQTQRGILGLGILDALLGPPTEKKAETTVPQREVKKEVAPKPRKEFRRFSV